MRAKHLLLSAALLSVSSMSWAADWAVESIAPKPEDVVYEASMFGNVRINFGDDWKFTVSEGATATLVNDETQETYTSTSMEFWEFAFNIEGKCYLKTVFPDVEANGNYLLTIPAGVLDHDGNKNPVLTYSYTLDDPALKQEEVPTLQLISVTPAADSELESVGLEGDGRLYSFDTNINKYVGYSVAMWYDVTDPDVKEWLCQADRNHEVGSESPIEILKVGDVPKMYAGHTYEMVVTCYDSYQVPRKELGTITVTYKGSTPAYVYATQKAIGVEPNPETYKITSAEEARFTVLYDGPVVIDEVMSGVSLGPAGMMPYTSVTSNAEKTEWTFVMPESQIEEKVVICFVLAKDEEGRTVRGNADMRGFEKGIEDNCGLLFEYQSDMSGVVLDVTPAAGTVESLKTFSVIPPAKYPDIVPSWLAFPYVVNGKDLVYTFKLEDDADYSEIGKMILTMPDEITEPGMYSLVIPAGAFMCSDEYGVEAAQNKELIVNYTIEGQVSEDIVYDFAMTSIDPAAGEVSELKNFRLVFADEVNLKLYDAYILDADGEQIRKADVEYDWDVFDALLIKLAEPVTEAGKYTLFIPKGTVGDAGFAESDNGHANDDIRIDYTITAVGVEMTGAEALRGDVYNVAGVLVLRDADAAAIKTLDKGIYIVNGKKIVVK